MYTLQRKTSINYTELTDELTEKNFIKEWRVNNIQGKVFDLQQQTPQGQSVTKSETHLLIILEEEEEGQKTETSIGWV